MGDYIACHTKITLNDYAPQCLTDFFDLIVSCDTIEESEFDRKFSIIVDRFKTKLNTDINNDTLWMFLGSSAYHEGYCQRIKLTCKQYLFLNSRKRFDKIKIIEFFKQILPFLKVKKGDVLFRFNGENEKNDNLLYVCTPECNELAIRPGIKYKSDYHFITDWRHSTNSEQGQMPWLPPMNIEEMINHKLL